MAVVGRASVIDIAKAIRDQLVARAGFQPSAIFITARKDIPHTRGEKDVILRITGEQAQAGPIMGAGRYNDQRTRGIVLTLRTRRATDQVGSDEKHLLNDDTGHIAAEDDIVDALEIFPPADLGQNWLVNCPVRVTSISESRPNPKAPEWLESDLAVEVDYSRSVNQAVQ